MRLDSLGLKNPKEALRYLRRSRQMGYAKVASKVLIPRDEARAYIDRDHVRPLA